MFTTVLLFLPFLTCLFWLALNPLFHKKDKTYGSLELFLAMTCIGMLAEAGFACTEGNVMLSFFFIRQFFALLIVPSAFDYNYRLIHSDGNNSFLLICISIPVSLLFAGIILLILSGTDGFIDCVRYPAAGQIDDVGRLIHFCSFWLFYGVLAIEVLLFAVYTLIMTLKGNRHLQIFNTTILPLGFRQWFRLSWHVSYSSPPIADCFTERMILVPVILSMGLWVSYLVKVIVVYRNRGNQMTDVI